MPTSGVVVSGVVLSRAASPGAAGADVEPTVLPGATVTLISAGRQLALGTTDPSGEFRLEVPALGSATVVVSAPGHRPSALAVRRPSLGTITLAPDAPAADAPAPAVESAAAGPSYGTPSVAGTTGELPARAPPEGRRRLLLALAGAVLLVILVGLATVRLTAGSGHGPSRTVAAGAQPVPQLSVAPQPGVPGSAGMPSAASSATPNAPAVMPSASAVGGPDGDAARPLRATDLLGQVGLWTVNPGGGRFTGARAFLAPAVPGPVTLAYEPVLAAGSAQWQLRSYLDLLQPGCSVSLVLTPTGSAAVRIEVRDDRVVIAEVSGTARRVTSDQALPAGTGHALLVQVAPGEARVVIDGAIRLDLPAGLAAAPTGVGVRLVLQRDSTGSAGPFVDDVVELQPSP